MLCGTQEKADGPIPRHESAADIAKPDAPDGLHARGSIPRSYLHEGCGGAHGRQSDVMVRGLQRPGEDLVQRGHVLAQGAHDVVRQLREDEQRALLQARVVALHALEAEGQQLGPPRILIRPARQLRYGVAHLHHLDTTVT